jgi:hypothetical protein
VSESAETSARPLLRIVRGHPTPEELAALLAVVGARSGGAEPAETDRRSPWATPVPRRPLSPGPGAWRASALPGL